MCCVHSLPSLCVQNMYRTTVTCCVNGGTKSENDVTMDCPTTELELFYEQMMSAIFTKLSLVPILLTNIITILAVFVACSSVWPVAINLNEDCMFQI